MEVRLTGASELTITGNIKSIDDYHAIKEAVRGIIDSGINSISIKVVDSISMSSSVIGFLLKTVYEDKANLSLYVKDERLIELLDILNLTTAFNVKKL